MPVRVVSSNWCRFAKTFRELMMDRTSTKKPVGAGMEGLYE